MDSRSNLRSVVAEMNEEEVRELCVDALYHLRVLTGSRNSFSAATMDALYEANIRLERQQQVEQMHRQAFVFLKKYDY